MNINVFAVFVSLAVIIAIASADVCPGVTVVPGGPCSEIWFSCVQRGTASLKQVGIEFGEQCGTPMDWTIASPGWSISPPNIPNIGMLYADGDASRAINGTATIGLGQWACTLDGQFVAAEPMLSNDFGTGVNSYAVDLFRREKYLGWGLHGVGYRTTENLKSIADLRISVPRLNSVPLASPTCNPVDGLPVGNITAQMTLLASSAQMYCYASTFNPCRCNGCPAGSVRVGRTSACCPVGDIIVGNGTDCNPTRCRTDPAPNPLASCSNRPKPSPSAAPFQSQYDSAASTPLFAAIVVMLTALTVTL